MTALESVILAAAAARRSEAVRTLQHLVAAARDGEHAVQAAVTCAADELGAEIDRVSYDPRQVPLQGEFAAPGEFQPGNREVLAACLRGSGGGRSLILVAHPDCEPIAGLDTWTRPPFGGEVVTGRLHGWGVADDLAGIAVMLEVARVLAAAKVALKGDLVLASTPSKRHGRGMAALMHRGLRADGVLYLHPAESGAGLGEIKAFTSGHLTFEVEVTGAPAPTTEPLQTALAHRAVNPIDAMLVVIDALRRLAAARAERVFDPALDEAVGRSTNLMISAITAGRADRLACVPDRCSIGVALSFPPGESLGAVQAEVEAAIRTACDANSHLSRFPARITWKTGTTGAETPVTAPLFETLADAVAAVTGRRPLRNVLHTGSDIRNPVLLGAVPALGIGPLCGSLSQNGASDEWIDVTEFHQAVAATSLAAARWCGIRQAV